MTRYAIRSVYLDGKQYNPGDIVPNHVSDEETARQNTRSENAKDPGAPKPKDKAVPVTKSKIVAKKAIKTDPKVGIYDNTPENTPVIDKGALSDGSIPRTPPLEGNKVERVPTDKPVVRRGRPPQGK